MAPDEAVRHATLGAVLIHSGHQAEGASRLRSAIILMPSVPGYYAALWQATQSVGDLRRGVILEPDRIEWRIQAGVLFNELERVDEASRHFRVCCVLDPSQSSSYANMAATSPEADGASNRRALLIEPSSAVAHFSLSTQLRNADDQEAALAELRCAIALAPDVPTFYNNFGVCAEKLGRFGDAREAGLRALHMKPSDAMFHASYASYLDKLDEMEQAARHYRASLALAPQISKTYQSSAINLIQWGQISSAKALLNRAILSNPANAEAFRHLLYLEDGGGKETHAALLQLIERAGDLPLSDRIDLHFAAGMAFDKAGEVAAATEQWIMANLLAKQTSPYDEAAALRRLDRFKQVFSAEAMEEAKGDGLPSEVPVFVIGMPRSGSTLLEQILASHPDIEGAGEIRDLSDLISAAGLDSHEGPDSSKLAGPVCRAIGNDYLRAVKGRFPQAARIVDKMLPNFVWAGLIHQIFPNARIIHISRNPIDSCMSNFSRRFVGSHPYSHDLGELGRYYRAYWALMRHWRTVLPEQALLDVRYEELVANFDSEAPRVINFLGLPWDERCRSFYKTERRVKTASQAQVRQPLYRSGIDRWRAYRPYIGPLLEALGDLAERE